MSPHRQGQATEARLPDARRLRLPVGRVLRLAGEVGAVVLRPRREPEGGDGVEPLAVGHQLLHGGCPVGDDRVRFVQPGDLKSEETMRDARQSEPQRNERSTSRD